MNFSAQLNQALPKLLEQWAPTHVGIFTHLLEAAASTPEQKLQPLIEELKADPHLFCWLLSKNARSVTRKPTAQNTPLNRQLVETLRWLNEYKIAPRQLHSHSLASLVQQRATRKTLARTAAADVLAPYFNVDRDSAFAVAALRELGLALIIWNYPRIYAHAVEHVERIEVSHERRTKLLDERLLKVLGFSPFTLSLAIAAHCQLSPEIQIGVGQSAEKLSATPEAKAVGESLAKIAEISEVFAQATMPDVGEPALARWNEVRAEIFSHIGAAGLSMLNDACAKVLQRYADVLPELATHPMPRPVRANTPRPHTKLFIQNLYIPHCTIELKELLHVTYAKLDPHAISYENITALMLDVAPKAGFNAGAFYLLNPDQLQLEPRVRLGGEQIWATPILYRDPSYREHPVARAFLGKAPVIENHEGSEKISFSGIIGTAQRVGVLHLEAVVKEPNQQLRPRMHFKALQQALTDCLNAY